MKATRQRGQDRHRRIDHLTLDLLVVSRIAVRMSRALEPGGHLLVMPWRDGSQLRDPACDREPEACGQQSGRADGRARRGVELPDLSATMKHGEVGRD